MTDGIEYRARLEKPNGDSREIVIITDTIQAALSIAKCKAKWDESVTSIYALDAEIYIDWSVCKEDGK